MAMEEGVGFNFYTAKDGVTPTFKKLTKGSRSFGEQASRAFSKATGGAKLFGTVMGGVVGGNLITSGLMQVKRGISSVTDEFLEFDHETTKAAAKFPENLERNSAAFESFAGRIRKVGAASQFTSAEAAQGMKFLAQAGQGVEQAFGNLPAVMQLATNADIGLAQATDIATDALGIFGLKARDKSPAALAKEMEGLRRINDVFAAGVNSATMDLSQLYASVSKGGKIFTANGQSMETYVALTAALADQGIKAEEGGTALRNAMLKLTAPSKEARKEMKKLGLEIEDPKTGKIRDIVDIVEDLRNALGGEDEFKKITGGVAGLEKAMADISDTEKSASLRKIFDVRGVASALVLMGEGREGLEKYRQAVTDSAGASKKMADQIGSSLTNRIKKLKSAAIEVGFKFVDAFMNEFPTAIDDAKKAIEEFKIKPVVDAVKEFLQDIKKLYSFIRDNMWVIKSLVGAWLAYKGVLLGVAALNAIGMVRKMAIAIQGQTASQIALNAAQKAGAATGVGTGKVGKGLAVAGAAAAGYAVGTVISQAIVQPAVEEDIATATKTEASATSAIFEAKQAFKFEGIEEQKKRLAEVNEQLSKVDDSLTFFDAGMSGILKLFSDEETQLDRAKRQAEELALARGMLTSSLLGAAADANRFAAALGASRVVPPNKADAQANANVNVTSEVTVNGAQNGASVETSTKGAPGVNMSMAGAN